MIQLTPTHTRAIVDLRTGERHRVKPDEVLTAQKAQLVARRWRKVYFRQVRVIQNLMNITRGRK